MKKNQSSQISPKGKTPQEEKIDLKEGLSYLEDGRVGRSGAHKLPVIYTKGV